MDYSYVSSLITNNRQDFNSQVDADEFSVVIPQISIESVGTNLSIRAEMPAIDTSSIVYFVDSVSREFTFEAKSYGVQLPDEGANGTVWVDELNAMFLYRRTVFIDEPYLLDSIDVKYKNGYLKISFSSPPAADKVVNCKTNKITKKQFKCSHFCLLLLVFIFVAIHICLLL